jgi:hypothetical protein
MSLFLSIIIIMSERHLTFLATRKSACFDFCRFLSFFGSSIFVVFCHFSIFVVFCHFSDHRFLSFFVIFRFLSFFRFFVSFFFHSFIDFCHFLNLWKLMKNGHFWTLFGARGGGLTRFKMTENDKKWRSPPKRN